MDLKSGHLSFKCYRIIHSEQGIAADAHESHKQIRGNPD